MAKSFNDLPANVQAVILAIIPLGLAGAVFYLYVFPLSAKKTAMQAEYTRLRAENQKNQAVERERTELLNRIAQLEKQLETLRTIVPDEPDTDEFVRMVYDTARGSAIYMRNFTAQPLVTRDYYMEMPFSVKIDGTYYQMLSFFDRLAKQQRIVSVSGLALGPPATGGGGTFTILPSETVGASCVITTFYNKPAAPAGPAKKK
ncbi:MAG: type 4a pilus biogenesis protein PilO [Terriglobia bacterium]